MTTRGVHSDRRDRATDIDNRTLRRIALASYVGSAIEFYDFFIYGIAAALVFPAVFFPELGHVVATTASLGTFASAFLARPVGAAVFGHFGDRLGRKQILVITLLLMGAATVGVGLIPSTASIGVAAPLLLIGLRLVQGFAVGGEWAGAALLSTEAAPPHKRGFYGMFTQLGPGTALVAANLAFLVVYNLFDVTGAAFVQWGWRIPFLLSAVLIATALYIRLHVPEPEAPAPPATRAHDGVPLVALMRRQGRQVALAAGAMICAPMLVYQAGTFFTHYATAHLGYSMALVLLVGVLGGLCAVGFAAASAVLSDTYGRQRIVGIGCGLAVPWSFAIFPLIEVRSPLVFGVAIAVTYAIMGICMGPLASFIPAIFAPEYRYTAAALAFNGGGIIGGALPPVVSPMLMTNFGGWAVAVLMGGLALVSFVSVVLLSERG